ncbi:MAG: DUF3124 domain-containing protein [Vicingaceae bacterium]
MKNLSKLFILIVLIQSCKKIEKTKISSIDTVNWENRTIKHKLPDSLIHGQTYLSVYSQIYSQTEQRTHDLTATVSLRNTNTTDTLYVDKAEYFGTEGNLIRTYFDKTIHIAPMETVEIIIDEEDQTGGTGANFLFVWKIKQNTNEPLFEAIMISTSGQQGLSFTTQGKRVK